MRKPLFVIERKSSGLRLLFAELCHYRELILFLTWRDILIRYKQTILGAVWEIIKPLSMMVIFTVVMGLIMKIPSDDMPYPLFFYSGSLIWGFFSAAFISASTSMVGSSNLITKVYFPRIIVPTASAMSGVFDFLIAFVLAILMMIYYKVYPGLSILVVVLVIIEVVLIALGVGLWFAAFLVRYRDVQNALPVLTTVWMFATPVFYPISVVPKEWLIIYSLNPMVSALSLFRWGIIGASGVPWELIAPGLVTTIILFVVGVLSFQKRERYFNDWL